MVRVELVEIAPPGREILFRFDLAVLVLVGAAEALLLAGLLGCLRRLKRRVAAAEQGSGGGRCGRSFRERGIVGCSGLPEQERAGHQQKTSRSPGEETRHEAPPEYKEIRPGSCPMRNGLSQLCGIVPRRRCARATPTRPSRPPGRRS